MDYAFLNTLLKFSYKKGWAADQISLPQANLNFTAFLDDFSIILL